MATVIAERLGNLNKRYITDLELYKGGIFLNLLKEHGWCAIPDSFWESRSRKVTNGMIFEKRIGGYCLKKTSKIEIAKINGIYRKTIYDINELPGDVIDELYEALGELATDMDSADDAFIERAEAKAHG